MSKRKRKRNKQAAVEVSPPRRELALSTPAVATAIAIIIALGTIARLRLLGLPLERDEGEYAYAGQLLLEGIPPYKLVYNMKFPGTYAAYALIEAIFGDTSVAIRIGLILVTGATALAVYFLGARLFGRIAGIAAAAAYTLLSLTLGAMGVYAHATHFVVLPAVAAFVLLARTGGGWRPLVAGALLAIATLMKQPGAAFAIFGVLWMLFEKRWRDATFVIAGGALVALATALTLKAAGVFDRFWFWTVQYAREYASVTSFEDARRYLTHAMHDIVVYAPALWIAIVLGIVLMLVEKTTRRAGVFVVAFIIVSFAATAAGLYFRPHYFLLMFPACALAAGGGVAAAMRLLPSGARLAAPIAYAVALLMSILLQWPVLAGMTPERITRAAHGDSPFNEAPAIAEYLRNHTAVDDRIAIFGSEPEIFFYADRKSATGYIYMYPLMERQPFAHRMQREMMAEVDRANPKYILSVNVNYSWLQQPDSDKSILEYAERKVNSGYKLDGIVDELPGGTVYVWGAEAERYQPRGSGFIMLFRRP